jgi:hypothetical protein
MTQLYDHDLSSPRPMAALKDEMVLSVDGILFVNPALALRERGQNFVRSRKWGTTQIFYGDQPEFSRKRQMWSLGFGLGLDHVPTTTTDWFADVAAILEFVRPIACETGCEFVVEFRLNSRPSYAEALGYVTGHPEDRLDLEATRKVLRRAVRCGGGWWRRLIGR